MKEIRWGRRNLIAAMIMMSFAGAACAQSSTSSDQQGASVFGIELGSPLTVPECSSKRIGDAVIYDLPSTGPCFQFQTYKDDDLKGRGAIPPNDIVEIWYPVDQTPVISAGHLNVGYIDGNVEWINFSTLGLQSQGRDLEILTKKFGPATSLTHPTLQNAYGAIYQGTLATWHLPSGVTVYFDAAKGGANSGSVIVRTKVAEDAMQAQQDRLNATRPQL